MWYMYLLLTILSGFTIVICMIFLGNLNKRVGLYQTTLINFIVSTIAATLLVVCTGQLDFGFLNTIPIYMYFGAVFALVITMLNSIIINKIPAVYTIILIFTGQLATGLLIDFYRSGALPLGDIIGGIVIIIGLLYNIKIDKLHSESTQT